MPHVQQGVRVRVLAGVSWDALARMSADEIRDKSLFPAGFLPLPHPNHPEGGMVFPKFQIDELNRQAPGATSRASTSTSICPIDSCPSFPRRST